MRYINVGVARVCITPPVGTALSGYYTPRYASGVHDDLFATAISFDDGEKRAILITLDLCGLKNQWWQDECKNKISEFCKIPLEAIIINCTHTHTGPIVGDDNTSGAESNKLYDDYLMVKIRDAAYLALKNLCPAKIYTGSGEVKDIAFVRLFKMADGTVKTNPGIGNPDIVSPISKAPEDVTLIKIEREKEKDIFIVNFGVHADVIGGTDISADFPGTLREIVEGSVPNSVCLFLQGAEGDLNHVNVKWERKPDKAEHSYFMGKSLANAVLKIKDEMTEVGTDKIKFGNRTITIPTNKEDHKLSEAKRFLQLEESGDPEAIKISGVKNIASLPEAKRIIEAADLPDEIKFNLSAISIGDVVFVGLPGEPFSGIGANIKKNSTFDATVICALTDGGEVYFPTGDIYDEDAYEAKSSLVKKGADNIIIEETLKLINDIK